MNILTRDFESMWLETKKARNFNAVVWVLGEVNGYAFAVSPNSNQRSDTTLTTATPLPNRSFGPKGPTPSFENTNGLNGTLFRGRDTSSARNRSFSDMTADMGYLHGGGGRALSTPSSLS